MKLELDFTKVYDKQKVLLEAKEEEIAFIGGVGSGKTHIGAMKMLLCLMDNPGSNGMVTAPSYRIIQEATMPKYEMLFPAELIKSRKARPFPTWELVTGGKIDFYSTDKPDTIVGGEYAFAHMDEASLSPYLAYINVKKRLRQCNGDGKTYPYQLWLTTTPKELNWIYLEFNLENMTDNKRLIRASTRENIFRGADELDAYIQKLGLNEAQMRQEVEGEFTLTAGDCFFDQPSLDMQMKNCIEPIETRMVGDSNRLGMVSIWQAPVVGGKYYAGADCSDEGEGGANCMVIQDRQTGAEVAEIYGEKLRADKFAEACFNLLSEYGNPVFAPERNGTVGGLVLQKLKDLEYPNLYIDDKGKEGWYTIAGNAIPPKVSRYTMIEEYREAVMLRTTIIRSPEAIGEMSTFVRDGTGKYKHLEGRKDDRVMARAITWQMRKSGQTENRSSGFMSIKRSQTSY